MSNIMTIFWESMAALKRAFGVVVVTWGCGKQPDSWHTIYLELVYLVTALVPSETACLANSPGRRSLTAV